jgi:hypothetical protein
MAEPLIDEMSPSYIREKRVDLTLDASVSKVRAFQPALLNISYERVKPEGMMLPLVLEVQGPSAQSYQRREFTKTLPVAFIFTPREGGPHLVTLREVGHNRWWGSLTLDAEGELLEAPKPV